MTAGPGPGEAITGILDEIRRKAGLSFTGSRLPHAEDTVRRHLEARQRSGTDGGVGGDAWLDGLIEQLTVGETYFFRHREQLDFVARTVFPALRQRLDAGAPVGLWSAGCSTGEEPYSLAILAAEAGVDPTVRIVGTDLSETALAIAEAGCYGRWSFRQCDEAFVSRYFSGEGRRFRLDPAIRGRVRFHRLNLMATPFDASLGLSAMSLILCRNVLIYFDARAAAEVTRRLLACLAPGGGLVVGPSDPRIRVDPPFRVVPTAHGSVYQRCVDDAAAAAPPPRPSAGRGWQPSAPAPAPSRMGAPKGAPSAARPSPRAAAAPLPATDLARVEATLSRGDFAAAEAVCHDALRRDPLSLPHLELHARALAGLGAWIDAAKALERALYVDPGSIEAHERFADVLDRLGEGRLAERARRNARDLKARRSAAGAAGSPRP